MDVVLANASLQWLPDHAALFPRLARSLSSGGCLAVQMPNNLSEPSHAAMREVAPATCALSDPLRVFGAMGSSTTTARLCSAGTATPPVAAIR